MSTAGTRFLDEHARCFVHRSNVTLPETIYDKEYYDQRSGLEQANPTSIRLHLKKNATIRNGHTSNQPSLYDFSFRRMLRHEIIAGLLTHYAFENKQQFLDVCHAAEKKILDSPEYIRRFEEYRGFCSNLPHNLIPEHGARMLEENPALAFQGPIGPIAEADLDEKFVLYAANILNFNNATKTPHRIGYDAKKVLGLLRAEWANVQQSSQMEELVRSVLLEEERIRWKERELWKLLCGEEYSAPGQAPTADGFDKGLLAKTVKELATPLAPAATPAALTPPATPVDLKPADAVTDKTAILFANLKPLKKLPKGNRLGQLVVGGSGAGKSIIINQFLKNINKAAPDEGVALLNTDWVKSMLLKQASDADPLPGEATGEDDTTLDPTQLGTITHAESAHVINLAAQHWQAMATSGLAPNLLAELTKAGDWRKEMSAGETAIKIWVVLKPALDAWRDAYVRGLQEGDDQDRFPPTETLVDSHAAQFEYNLDAIVDGLPLEFVSLPDKESSSAMGPATLDHKPIATYDPQKRVLYIYRMPEMLEYFSNRQLNSYAYDHEGLWQGTQSATAANMLKYTQHMGIESFGIRLAYNETHHKFDCAIESWNALYHCMQDDQDSENEEEKQKGKERAKRFIAALAEQYVLDEHGKKQFLVDFSPDPTMAADLAVQGVGVAEAKKPNAPVNKTTALLEAIVAESKDEKGEGQLKNKREQAIGEEPDPSLRFQELGRQLDKAGKAVPPDHLANKLKRYADTLERLTGDAAQSTTPDFRFIECEPWIAADYPKTIEYLQKLEHPKNAELGAAKLPDMPRYLVFDTRCGFGTYPNTHERLGAIERVLEQNPNANPDVRGIRLLPEDVIEKYFDDKSAFDRQKRKRIPLEDEGVSLCASKAANNVVAFQVDGDTDVFSALPASLQRAEFEHSLKVAKGRTKPEENSDWIVMPRRYAEGIKNQLAAFDLALENQQWDKALHCLFHANGKPRFPCRIMKDADFRKEFRPVPQKHQEDYKALLAVVLDAYTNHLLPRNRHPLPGCAVVRLTHEGDKALIMVQPEKTDTYTLPATARSGGKAITVKGPKLFGIEVSSDPHERRAEVAELRRRLQCNENMDTKKYPIVAHSRHYIVNRDAPPEMDGQEAEVEENLSEDTPGNTVDHPKVQPGYRLHARRRFTRRDGMHQWGRAHSGPHRTSRD